MTERFSENEVPYTAAQMFELVADVERYPEFLPWCKALRILTSDIDGTSGKMMAEMVVAYKVFREQFRSEVLLDGTAKRIDAYYLDGPFRHLHNNWQFRDKPEGGSIVHFHIDFEFSNVVMQTAARTVFEKAFARMSEAFISRADEIYGAPATAYPEE